MSLLNELLREDLEAPLLNLQKRIHKLEKKKSSNKEELIHHVFVSLLKEFYGRTENSSDYRKLVLAIGLLESVKNSYQHNIVNPSEEFKEYVNK